MSERGQTERFALVEPRASFTLTSRPSPRQSSRRTRANAVGNRSLSAFGKKSRMGDQNLTEWFEWTDAVEKVFGATSKRNNRITGAEFLNAWRVPAVNQILLGDPPQNLS
jgi:hypothetical protein